MTTAQICIILAIGIYLVGMIGIGLFFNRTGGETSSDFYLGGRSLGPVVTAMSAEASDMSSYLLMGLPGLAYLCGVAEVGWTVIGLAVGTYLNWLIVAKRLRRYSAVTGAITIPDFFSRRYGDKRHILACIAAVIILIFFVPYTASGFKAVGTLFPSCPNFSQPSMALSSRLPSRVTMNSSPMEREDRSLTDMVMTMPFSRAC